jgi:hypothetical protein
MCRYKRRVRTALKAKQDGSKQVMSMIIDRMDQSNCQVPNKGGQGKFAQPLKMGLTGVKEHGEEVVFYRTIDTVKKCANMTIFCIMSQLQRYRERSNCYPEELYLQVDGGAENANGAVLAALELLVVKRIVKEVYFTRLPTGCIYFLFSHLS